MAALGLLVLRLTLASVFIAHGAHELFGAFAGPGFGPGGLSNTAAHFAAMGVTQGFAAAVLGALIQLVGGICLAVGFGVRPTAVLIAALLGFEIWKDQSRWGFFLNWTLDPGRGHGAEYFVVLIGVLFFLVISGAGAWSVDGRRATRVASRAAGRARLRRP